MVAVTDIRLACSFRDHPKRKKLQRRLGAAGVLALVDLWSWCGTNKPTGDLAGMDDEDIEIAAGWDGAAGVFVTTLRELRLLDERTLHDWETHQGWAFGAAERSQAARVAGLASAEARKGKKPPVQRPVAKMQRPVQRPVDETATGSQNPSNPVSFPSPSPSPSREAKEEPPPPARVRGEPTTLQQLAAAWSAGTSDLMPDAQSLGRLLEHLDELHGKWPKPPPPDEFYRLACDAYGQVQQRKRDDGLPGVRTTPGRMVAESSVWQAVMRGEAHPSASARASPRSRRGQGPVASFPPQKTGVQT